MNKYIAGCDASIPADTVILFEADNPGKNAAGGEELAFPKHSNGANFLFGDMHVEFVKKEDFGKLKWKP
jgi:prepilin-type processing-associated H-X9-DG protein